MANAFTGELIIQQMSGTPEAWRRWMLHEPLVYGPVTVPAGFVSDGPSVPQVFQNILPVWGSWGRAGVLHDYLCARIALGHPHKLCPNRNVADLIFADAMIVLQVTWYLRILLYIGVRLGTWFKVPPTMVNYNRALLLEEIAS